MWENKLADDAKEDRSERDICSKFVGPAAKKQPAYRSFA
jgi:hypothetical protein